RADESRPLRDGDRAEIGPGRVGIVERALNDAADIANVLAGRELGHDTAPFAGNLDLRCDDVGSHRPRPGGIAGLLDHGRGRFVAGRFNAQDAQTLPSTTRYRAA